MSVNTIVGAGTALTAFVDFFERGPVEMAVHVTGAAEFENIFGGVSPASEASYGIREYFLNGGSEALVVRVVPVSATAASADLNERFQVIAANPGEWGNRLSFCVAAAQLANTFSLRVNEMGADGIRVVNSENYTSLSMAPDDPNYCLSVVSAKSKLIRMNDRGADTATTAFVPADSPAPFTALADGSNGVWADAEPAEALCRATTALSGFNILCIPAAASLDDAGASVVYVAAAAYCRDRRAFLIVDIPSSDRIATPAAMVEWFQKLAPGYGNDCTAVYYPRLLIADPLNESRRKEIACSGAVAGVYARTDSKLGVWKAPAGAQAVLAGAEAVYKINEPENNLLNPLGINSIRKFPGSGTVVWGARTMGNAAEWKYVPVRRLAHFLENSLEAGLSWVVSEPNDPQLWSAITLSAGEFLNTLFRQGAFAGSSARDAYFVRCDATTTTESDIDAGLVNILVGFAPTRPREFAILQIRLTTRL